MMTSFSVIKRPIISEKSTALSEVAGKYVFEVSRDCRKEQIRDAVKAAFGVDVRSVRTIVVPGKVKRTAKGVVKRSSWKKAIVTIGEGQKIDFFKLN